MQIALYIAAGPSGARKRKQHAGQCVWPGVWPQTAQDATPSAHCVSASLRPIAHLPARTTLGPRDDSAFAYLPGDHHARVARHFIAVYRVFPFAPHWRWRIQPVAAIKRGRLAAGGVLGGVRLGARQRQPWPYAPPCSPRHAASASAAHAAGAACCADAGRARRRQRQNAASPLTLTGRGERCSAQCAW